MQFLSVGGNFMNSELNVSDIHKLFYENKYKKTPVPTSSSSIFWHKAIEYAKNNQLDICPFCDKEINRHKIISHGVMQIKCKRCGHVVHIRENEIQNIQKNITEKI